MIDFNIPPYVGKEMDYIKEAIINRKICGDGEFTKRCSNWMKDKFNVNQAFLTTSCTHALEMAAVLSEVSAGDEVILPLIRLYPLQMPLSKGELLWYLWISGQTP